MAVTLWAALAGGLSTSDLFSLNPASAAPASIGATGYAITGFAIDPTDPTKLYGVTSPGSSVAPKSLIRIDISVLPTVTVTLVGSLGKVIPDIAFDSTGQMYGWNNTDGVLTKINKTTAALTNLGASGIPGGKVGSGIAVDSGDVCYLFPKGSTANYYVMNLTSGAGTLAGSLDGSGAGTTITAASFDGDDVCWAVNGNGSTVSELDQIDVGTGVKTLIGEITPHDGSWDALVASGSAGGAAPTPVSAVAANLNVVVTFDQPLDPASVPLPAQFDVKVNGVSQTVVSVAISGNDVTLVMAAPITRGAVVTVDYTYP